jgi:MGT family glycosyltransferase
MVVPVVLENIREMKFDYMIHDVMFGGGNILSRKLNIPAISTSSSFVMEKLPVPPRMLEPGFHPQLDSFYVDFDSAKKEWGIEDYQVSDLFFKKEAFNLVFTSRLFQPMGDTYDETYHFAGPSVTDREESMDFTLKQDKNDKVIYITMGTINNQLTGFYNKCIEAFREEKFRVVMSVGNKLDVSAFDPIPKHFIIRNYIPQLEVLKQTDVMISHGGLNSVSEALYYGVPVIAIPLANDQPMVARRLMELGAGMELKMEDVTPELLRESVHKILEDKNYQENSKRIRSSFLEAGDSERAAGDILSYIHERKHE